MKRTAQLAGLAVAALALWSSGEAADLGKLHVLYIGDAGSERSRQFESCLREKVASIKVAPRASFQAGQAEGMDVVMLDWPQSEQARAERGGRGPLGDRSQWIKPTVLLGSAGLNVAITWKGRGGSG